MKRQCPEAWQRGRTRGLSFSDFGLDAGDWFPKIFDLYYHDAKLDFDALQYAFRRISDSRFHQLDHSCIFPSHNARRCLFGLAHGLHRLDYAERDNYHPER